MALPAWYGSPWRGGPLGRCEIFAMTAAAAVPDVLDLVETAHIMYRKPHDSLDVGLPLERLAWLVFRALEDLYYRELCGISFDHGYSL